MPEDGTASETESQQSPPAEETPSQPPSGPPEQPRDPGTGQFQSPNDPAWAQGKSREEIISLSQQVFQQLPQLQQQQQQPQQERQVAPQPAPSGALGPPDPDLQYSDPATYQRQLEAYQTALIQRQMETMGQQALGPLYKNQAMVNRRMVAQDPDYADVFSKFGLEIDTQMASVNFEQRTIEAYQWVADRVRGTHWKEFAHDYAADQRQTQEQPTVSASEQPIPGAEPSYRDPLDEFWDSGHGYVRNAISEGLTKNDIRENVNAMGLDVPSYIKAIQAGNVVFGKTGITRDGLVAKNE
jgi:hypothetical protein